MVSCSFSQKTGFNRHDPNNFVKKGQKYIDYPKPEKLRCQSAIKKPRIPTLDDKPIMGLKSDKNYVTSNAVDVILMSIFIIKKSLKEKNKRRARLHQEENIW